MRRAGFRVATLIVAILVMTACGQPGDPASPAAAQTSDQVGEDAVATTSVPEAQQATIEPTSTEMPSPTATMEPSPTVTATNTIIPPMVSVSENTNCRSGQDSGFEFLGVLSVGERAAVAAKSTQGDYWYIENPDDPGSYCWLWGEYATIEGDTAGLLEMTPEPTYTPQVGFEVWFHGLVKCSYGDMAIFAIRNAGAQRLWSGFVTVYEAGTGQRLYGPARERHPFAESDPACPPGHGNELYPGQVLYIHTPLNPSPSGSDAYAEITLCSADHGGGDCVTKIGYFYIP